ncbi:MAG: hypothetical protein R6V54_11880 [Desulfobacteraceae bacterium]
MGDAARFGFIDEIQFVVIEQRCSSGRIVPGHFFFPHHYSLFFLLYQLVIEKFLYGILFAIETVPAEFWGLVITSATRHIWRANGVRLLLLTLSDRTAQSNHKVHDNVNNESLTPPQVGRCYDQARVLIPHGSEIDAVQQPERREYDTGPFRESAGVGAGS